MGLIWTKILIALRGRGHDESDAIMFHEALRILDQELCEAQMQVGMGRSSLANLMTKHILAAREAGQTAGRLAELTGSVQQALVLGHHDLALDLAAHIGRLERVLDEDERVARQYAASVDTLRTSLERGESELQALRRQIDALRMPETRRLPSSATCDASAHFQAVADSLDAICQRQREAAAHLDTQNQLCLRDPCLEQRLREPLIIPDESDAHAVLARIRTALQPTCDSPH
ncbi:PspA/IM30 family protein [Pseudomonas syringae]|nr:PspA/IM30 family protein [Pseudomonas syringae]MBD8573485.1 PspA/IM30 family protein [Pseudomonas syringae]MBD8790062.1 PspA/IM30 family protein [Pseudomonas syringae]MBD8800037.1 PspA/IM30 family protein [Pseudomonas syringae]MBD8810967.1 PspA/IM30 family protein [Pseudomonas syringae]